jgi:hypothetical protein
MNASIGSENEADGSVGALGRMFDTPPDAARPWVYWYFQDGHLSRDGMRADLEAMKKAGIGGALFLEVTAMNVPSGPVEFMSPRWQGLVVEAMRDCERLGLEFALGTGPGWCGDGGPWIGPDDAMQHLVGASTVIEGGQAVRITLEKPPPRDPYFGRGTLTPGLMKEWSEYYRDVAVIAYPTPTAEHRISDLDEKALYVRHPYSSKPGVKAYLPPDPTVLAEADCIDPSRVIDLSGRLSADGTLEWDAPEGSWTVVRLGRTLTGQTTRPAPAPGLGWESGKFDRSSVEAHIGAYLQPLFERIGATRTPGRGWNTLHFDSWEMSSQNWSATFREEFRSRRGYDSLAYLPVMLGAIVGSVETSERFLWDFRRTAQEVVFENHMLPLKQAGTEHGLSFTIEPYDLNPSGDLALGDIADTPSCEFWSNKFNTNYSAFEAASSAHTRGRKVVQAEAFTSHRDAWRHHPGLIKDRGDWGFCAGVNRFAFHRYSAQPELDERPGLPWGPYGVHWERTQTWWEMVPTYHAYLSRCQAMLQTGLPVADVLYLDIDDAPSVFCPPPSALLEGLPDRRGYSFDGCSPGTLIERASAKDGRIVFPDGMSYRLLVLPRSEAMRPELLRKVAALVEGGAWVMGSLPTRAAGLSDAEACDAEIADLSRRLRDRIIPDSSTPPTSTDPSALPPNLYPEYSITARVLANRGVLPDFESNGDLRYTHRVDGEVDFYFVGNRTAATQNVEARFRVTDRWPELWDPVTGERRALREFAVRGGLTCVRLEFAAYQSYFLVFAPRAIDPSRAPAAATHFPVLNPVADLSENWTVTFDPRSGGPDAPVTFATLDDWSQRSEAGIRYYSGSAVYEKTFDFAGDAREPCVIDVGEVAVMGEVWLNGCALGVVWCAPWRVVVPAGVMRASGNRLRIKVANLWCNRLIGDSGLPAPDRVARLSGATIDFYTPDSPLERSGLLGPVRILSQALGRRLTESAPGRVFPDSPHI